MIGVLLQTVLLLNVCTSVSAMGRELARVAVPRWQAVCTAMPCLCAALSALHGNFIVLYGALMLSMGSLLMIQCCHCAALLTLLLESVHTAADLSLANST